MNFTREELAAARVALSHKYREQSDDIVAALKESGYTMTDEVRFMGEQAGNVLAAMSYALLGDDATAAFATRCLCGTVFLRHRNDLWPGYALCPNCACAHRLHDEPTTANELTRPCETSAEELWEEREPAKVVGL